MSTKPISCHNACQTANGCNGSVLKITRSASNASSPTANAVSTKTQAPSNFVTRLRLLKAVPANHARPTDHSQTPKHLASSSLDQRARHVLQEQTRRHKISGSTIVMAFNAEATQVRCATARFSLCRSKLRLSPSLPASISIRITACQIVSGVTSHDIRSPMGCPIQSRLLDSQ